MHWEIDLRLVVWAHIGSKSWAGQHMVGGWQRQQEEKVAEMKVLASENEVFSGPGPRGISSGV